MIINYIITNWFLLLLPSILSILLWFLYKKDKKRYSSIDKSVTCFVGKVFVVCILAIMSVVLIAIKNALAVVIIMVVVGEVLNAALILVNSTELQDRKRKKYWCIVKEEYIKSWNQKRRHHKNIMQGKDIQFEKNEYERKEEIIGCATITLILLVVYSFYINEKEMSYIFLSYLVGKFMWMDGGLIEGLSSIFYYLKKELSTAVVLVIIWWVNTFVIEKYDRDVGALCIGLIIPMVMFTIALIGKYRRNKKEKPQ